MSDSRFTRHQKCERCGFKYGFHICLDMTLPENQGPPHQRGRKYEDRKKPSPYTIEHRENISASQKLRWEKIRKMNEPRDMKILEDYAKGDIGTRELAKKYGIGYHQLRQVLKRGEEAGTIEMRPRGKTIYRPGKG